MNWIDRLGASPFRCPVELTLEVLGGKWSVVLLAHLKEAPHRYSELRKKTPPLSEKMLTQRLRELTEKGLIVRSQDDQESPRYELTARGQSLRPVLESLYAWGDEFAAELGMDWGAEEG